MASTHRSSIILVTGGSPHEGAGKAAAAVGAALAQFSRRVLVVDGDFRHPSLHLEFGISNENGLAAALRDPEVSFGRFTTPIEERLFALPAGDMPPSVTVLLNSQRIGYVLRALAEEFDFVVICGAPAVEHADTLMWAALADEVLIVGSRGKISRRDLARSIKAVNRTNRPIWGVVLTEG
jgi:Mrp family chromosome partitioning ATPase